MSGRAAGVNESEVGAGADVLKGFVLCLTHLSHTFGGLTAHPRGLWGSCAFTSSVVPRWPTCGSAAVSVASARVGPLSREIITLPAPSPLNTHSSLPLRVCLSERTLHGRDCNPCPQMNK